MRNFRQAYFISLFYLCLQSSCKLQSCFFCFSNRATEATHLVQSNFNLHLLIYVSLRVAVPDHKSFHSLDELFLVEFAVSIGVVL